MTTDPVMVALIDAATKIVTFKVIEIVPSPEEVKLAAAAAQFLSNAFMAQTPACCPDVPASRPL